MRALLLAFLMLFSVSSLASLPEPSLELFLESIEMMVPEEKGGDQLFLIVTEYTYGHDKAAPVKQTTFPEPPAYWPSKSLSAVKHVPIWAGKITANTGIELMMNLGEIDRAPWEVDDDLGDLKFVAVLEEKTKTLNTFWSVPEHGEVVQEKADAKEAVFIFSGSEAKYRLTFNIVKQ